MELITTPENPAPDGAVVSAIRAADGMSLRVVRWHPQGRSKGTLVICPGRAEFLEKYFETAGELLQRGLTVVAFDWRGQGLSGREVDNPQKGHIDDMVIYERDIDALVIQALEPFCPKPWFGLGHSMGGAILIAMARRGTCPFERIVTIAPMIDLYQLRMASAARLLAEVLDAIGLGGAFVPGGRSKGVIARSFKGNPLTSDPVRFERCASAVRVAPQLEIGDPTIGWVNAAFRLMREFEDAEYPRRTLTPTLVFAAGDDRIVDLRAVERFATRLKAGRLIVIPLAQHEILMERDVFRSQFWAGFDAFIPGTRELAKAPLAASA